MIRILTEHPGDTDATQWYRGAGPLADLCKTSNVQVTFSRDFSWGEIKAHDIVFFLRPAREFHAKTMETAKKLGVKTWIDFDDHLLDLPPDNPAYEFYNNPSIQSQIRTAMRLADVISVSTEFLRKEFNAHGNAVVVPNSIDPSVLQHRPTKPPSKNLIMWRGTSTHFKDLMHYSDAIIDIANKNPEWRFAFVGYNPWFITEKIQNKIHIPSLKLLDYHQGICSLRPVITMVPLFDSKFNRSKSNIAALEATLACSAVLAPDWEEWQIEGIQKYRDISSFHEKLTLMMKNPAMWGADHAWEDVQKRYLLSTVNRLRDNIIQKLVG